MKPREIIVNGRFLLRPVTGVERFAESIIRGLCAVRSDIRIVTPPTAESLRLPAESIGRTHGHAWEQIDLPRYCRLLGDPLLVSLCSTGPVRYRRQIVAHHDITYIRHPESFSRRFRLLYRAIVPRLLKNAQAVVTVSEFSKSEIHAHYGIPEKKIRVIANAAGAQFAPSSSGERGDSVLAVSSPNAHKNFDRLVAACRETDCDLRIVGQQPAHFAQQRPQAPLRPNPGSDANADRPAGEGGGVTYTGRLSDDDLVREYQRARAFIFPSIYEGFGIPPLEAQACGTPVVAARAASLPEVLGDSALYVDPFDTADIARGIREILQPEVAADYARRGLENVQRFSWEDSVADLNALIDDCLAEEEA